jgi:hypothetical protein
VTLLFIRFTDENAITLQLTCAHYLTNKRINRELSLRTRKCLASHIRKRSQGDQVVSEIEMVNCLPNHLRRELHREARGPIVTMKFHLLRDLMTIRPRVLLMVCHKAMDDVQGTAGDNIFNVGDECSCMYFIDSGTLNYLRIGFYETNDYGSNPSITSDKNGGTDRPSNANSWSVADTASSSDVAASGAMPVTRGTGLSESALWTPWINHGHLCATSDCTVLRLHSAPFFMCMQGEVYILLHVIQYCRKYVKHVNEMEEALRHDMMNIRISDNSMNATDDEDDDVSSEGEKLFVFLSHYKLESGTEAVLLQQGLERLLQEATTLAPTLSVFLDSDNLTDLCNLRNSVKRSHNLVLLLTPGVLRRPWCLVEIVTAMEAGVPIVPVEVQRPGSEFQYPTDSFYSKLRSGKYFSAGATGILKNEGIELAEVEKAIRQVFTKISLPFSPHKTSNVRNAELTDIVERCLQNVPNANLLAGGATRRNGPAVRASDSGRLDGPALRASNSGFACADPLGMRVQSTLLSGHFAPMASAPSMVVKDRSHLSMPSGYSGSGTFPQSA